MGYASILYLDLVFTSSCMYRQHSVKNYFKLCDVIYGVPQACQTQTIARVANWVLKLEKLRAGHSLELHDT
jgi:hypothetical protein